MIKKRKVVIVGAGNVGASTAFCMINQGICDEIVLIDMNTERAKGETLDMIHSIAFMNRNMEIKLGDYTDCKDADVLVITASAPMGKENDRLVALKSSSKIVTSIVSSVIENGFDGFIVVVSNPVDIMTYVAYKVSALPANQIIGSGTLLDSARLQCHIADCIDVDPKSIHAYVLGEHGDSEMIPWSTVRVGGKDIYQIIKDNPTRMNEGMFESIHEAVKKDGWEIFNRKGNTCYGIAASTTRIVRALMFNESVVLPISTYLDGQYGQDGVFTSVPAVLDATGVKEVVEIEMTKEEKEQFDASCSHLQSFYKEV